MFYYCVRGAIGLRRRRRLVVYLIYPGIKMWLTFQQREAIKTSYVCVCVFTKLALIESYNVLF